MEIWIMVVWKQRYIKHGKNPRMVIIRKKQALNKCLVASFEHSRDKLEHERLTNQDDFIVLLFSFHPVSLVGQWEFYIKYR